MKAALMLVPLFMFLSSCLMALAWLGHLRFQASISFSTALGVSWLLVLPEYVLNVAATRFGYGRVSTLRFRPLWHLSASSASYQQRLRVCEESLSLN